MIYITARTQVTQLEAKINLDLARRRTDQTIMSLAVWPVNASDDPMFRSRHLFAAILGNHRSSVRIGSYFWDEIQFYTDTIDIFLGWMNRNIRVQSAGTSDDDAWKFQFDIGQPHQHLLHQLMQSYSYLMAAISYLGAEQALCSVFHSVVCLSHRETFYYANFSFSAEALFRLYRQSYPLSQTGGDESATTAWRTASHQAFFPLMFSCRQEILADLDYVGMSSDQTPCSHTRKNETRFNEIELLTDVELKKVGEAVAKAMTSQSADSRVGFAVAAASLIATTFYIVAAHVTRFVAIEAWNVRVKRKRKVKQLAIKTSQLGNNHLILDQLAVNHLQVSAAASTADAGCTDTSDSSSAAAMCNNCSDYSITNQNSNFIGFKVATV